MERVRQFFSAILAGMLIGMGGTVFLSQSNPVVGSFLFAIGLFTIVVFQLHLFTGKVGYTPFNKPVYLIELVVTWLGNLVGTWITATMVRNSRIYEGMAERVAGMAEVKLSDDFTSIFLLAVFCGMLMFIAVDCFRNVQGSTLRFIGVFVPVIYPERLRARYREYVLFQLIRNMERTLLCCHSGDDIGECRRRNADSDLFKGI